VLAIEPVVPVIVPPSSATVPPRSASMAAISSVPPETFTEPSLRRALAAVSRSRPERTSVPPEKVLAPPSESVPSPSTASLPEPASTPVSVIVKLDGSTVTPVAASVTLRPTADDQLAVAPSVPAPRLIDLLLCGLKMPLPPNSSRPPVRLNSAGLFLPLLRFRPAMLTVPPD
jgi:hypothetical protein